MTLIGLHRILEEILLRDDWRVMCLEGEHDGMLWISRIEALDLLMKLERFSPAQSD